MALAESPATVIMTPDDNSQHSATLPAESRLESTADSELAQKVATDDFEPPDGGTLAWCTAAGACLVAFSTFGMLNTFGTFLDFYQTTYLTGYSPTVISLIGSIGVFVLYFTGALTGALFDAIGPSKIIPASGVIVVFSIFMLSITKPDQIYQQFLTQGILFSIGASLGFFPAIAIIQHWFKSRAPLVNGIYASGASVGGIVFPLMLQRLIPRIGFGWSVRIVAFIMMFCYILACLLIQRRRPVKPLPPLSRLLDLKAFTEPVYLSLAIGAWLSIFAFFNPFFYIGLYGIQVYGSSGLTPYFLAIMGASSVLGRMAPGFLAVYIGRFNMVAISNFISALLVLAMWYNATNEGVTLAFAILYGIFSGPFFSLVPACIAAISPIDRIGARTGQLFAFMSFGALAGSPISGVFIREPTVENFRHLIIFGGCTGLAGSFFLFLARFLKDRRLFAVV